MGKIKILEDKVDASSKRVARVSMLAIGVDRKKEISTEHINRVLILMEEGRHNIPLLFLEHKKGRRFRVADGFDVKLLVPVIVRQLDLKDNIVSEEIILS